MLPPARINHELSINVSFTFDFHIFVFADESRFTKIASVGSLARQFSRWRMDSISVSGKTWIGRLHALRNDDRLAALAQEYAERHASTVHTLIATVTNMQSIGSWRSYNGSLLTPRRYS